VLAAGWHNTVECCLTQNFCGEGIYPRWAAQQPQNLSRGLSDRLGGF